MTPPLLADALGVSAPSSSQVVSSDHFSFGIEVGMPEAARVAIRLRAAPSSADVEAVRRVLRATRFFSDEEIAVAGQIVAQRLVEGPACEYETILADDLTGAVVGYICFGHIALTHSSHEVYWLAVDPHLQGGGVGRRLLREAEKTIESRGGTQVFIETAGRPQYAPTHRFYQRVGYTESARLRDFYAPGDDKLVFAKRLA